MLGGCTVINFWLVAGKSHLSDACFLCFCWCRTWTFEWLGWLIVNNPWPCIKLVTYDNETNKAYIRYSYMLICIRWLTKFGSSFCWKLSSQKMLYRGLFYLLFCVFVLHAVWLLPVSFIEKYLYLLLFQYVAVVYYVKGSLWPIQNMHM